MVWLEITHSVLSLRTEKNFDIDTRIETLKTRLYSIVGTSPSHMQLQLFSVDGQLVHGDMPDDSTLGQCGCTMDHMRVHVIDNDPTSSLSQLNNVESVQKYVISEEDYDKRDDTFRKWKERNLGSAELEQQQQGEQQQLQKQTEEQQLHAELIKNIKAGDRCQLNNELSARGTVRYVGKATQSMARTNNKTRAPPTFTRTINLAIDVTNESRGSSHKRKWTKYMEEGGIETSSLKKRSKQEHKEWQAYYKQMLRDIEEMEIENDKLEQEMERESTKLRVALNSMNQKLENLHLRADENQKALDEIFLRVLLWNSAVHK